MLKELGLVAHALSDQTRLRILKLLALRPICVCELTYILGAGQSRVSQNLAILKYAGLVTDERYGRLVYYSLNRSAFDEVIRTIRDLVAEGGLDNVPDMAAERQRWLDLQANPRVLCPVENPTISGLVNMPTTTATP